MHSSTRIFTGRAARAVIRSCLLASTAIAGIAGSARADFFQTNNLVTDNNTVLTSKNYAAAVSVDPNLINPWGISFGATPPWVSDNGTGVSTIYSSAGVVNARVVKIPGPAGSAAGFVSAPTGQVNNTTTSFVVSSGGKSGVASFLFATEDGTISGWNSGVNGTNAILTVDNSASGAVYKGLAEATAGGSPLLYAANFRSGNVETYNGSFQKLGTFTDPNLPAGYGAFNVQALNGNLYVAFAKQDAAKHDDVAGTGNGFVDEFTTSGNFIKRVTTGGPLNSPWGLAVAPAGFGRFTGDLLVGNFGNGEINAFDPNSGAYLGTLYGADGNPLVLTELWGLMPATGGSNGAVGNVWFTAAISGEQHGLVGTIGLSATTSGTDINQGTAPLVVNAATVNTAQGIAASGPVIVEAGSTLTLDGSRGAFTIANKVSLAGTGVGGQSALVVPASSGLVTLSGPLGIAADTSVGVNGSLWLSGPVGATQGGESTVTNLTFTGTGSGNVQLTGTVTDWLAGSRATGQLALWLSGAQAPTLQLSGANSYSGGTWIQGGTLVAGNAQALGQGSVTLQGGVLRTDGVNHVINVGGNYLQSGGTLMLQLLGNNQSEQLLVAGNAQLGGTLQIVSNGSFVPRPLDRYQVVSASGTISGGFSSIVAPAALAANVNYSTHAVTLGQLSFVPFATSANQTAVARGLDAVLASGAGGFGPLIGALDGLATGSQLAAAYDELSPQRFEILRNLAFDQGTFYSLALGNWLESGARGASGFDFSGFNVQQDGALAAASMVKVAAPSMAPRDGADPAPQEGSLHGFVSGRVTVGNFDAVPGQTKSSATSSGVLAGLGYQLTDQVIVGPLVGYSHSDGRIDGEGSKINLDSVSPGLFAAYSEGDFRAHASFAYGIDNVTSDRMVLFGPYAQTAHATPKATAPSFGGGVGYDFAGQDGMRYGPTLDAVYTRLSVDSFTEQNGGGANLSVANQSSESFRSRLGGQLNFVQDFAGTVIHPAVSLAWQHEFAGKSSTIAAVFAQANSGGFAVSTIPMKENAIVAGLNLAGAVGDRAAFFLGYQVQAGAGETAHDFMAGFKLSL